MVSVCAQFDWRFDFLFKNGIGIFAVLIIVVGSGIIGSWVAYKLALEGEEVFVIDQSPNSGDGISGRNSGVLHSGIYYDSNSLKSKFCFKGYEISIPFFQKNKIPFSICGKVITTGLSDSLNEENEKIKSIESLYQNGKDFGIEKIELYKALLQKVVK